MNLNIKDKMKNVNIYENSIKLFKNELSKKYLTCE